MDALAGEVIGFKRAWIERRDDTEGAQKKGGDSENRRDGVEREREDGGPELGAV